MKRRSLVWLLLACLLCMAGCGSADKGKKADSDDAQTVTEAPQTITTEPEDTTEPVLTITDAGNGLLTWNAVADASFYEIDFRFEWKESRVGSGGHYITVPEPKIWIHREGISVRVRAVTEHGEGKWSDWLTYGTMTEEIWTESSGMGSDTVLSEFFGMHTGIPEDTPTQSVSPEDTPTQSVSPEDTPTQAVVREQKIIITDAGNGLLTWNAVKDATEYEIEYMFEWNGECFGSGGQFIPVSEPQVRLYKEGITLRIRPVIGDSAWDWSDWFTYGTMTETLWKEVSTYSVSDTTQKYFGMEENVPEPTQAPSPTPVPTQAPIVTPEPELKLIKNVKTDKTTAEVYKDDTTVTYTVTTSADVEQLTLLQVEAVARNYSEPEQYIADIGKTEIVFNRLTVDRNSLTDKFVTSEDGYTRHTVARTVKGDEAVWTVRWDLGHTAVKFIRIEAKNGAETEEQYLKLNIHYPVIDYRDGLEEVIHRFVEGNYTEPFFFTLDPATITNERDYKRYFSFNEAIHIFEDEETMLAGMLASRTTLQNEADKYDAIDYDLLQYDNEEFYRYMFSLDPIYSGGFMDYLPQGSMLFNLYYSTPDAHEHWSPMKRNVLFSHYEEGATFGFYADMADDMRAIIAYRNGYSIDKEKFPYAYSVLEKAAPVVDKIITDDMTMFEKEHAIYQWMIDNYYNGLKGMTGEMSLDELYHCLKTSYGLLNGYHGDCSGWSATFYTLCNMAGVPCTFVDCIGNQAGGSSDAGDEEFEPNHRLNYVMIDDEFYFVEVYWFYQKVNPALGDWRYFNLNTEEAKQRYTWRSEEYFGVPETDATRHKVDEHTGKPLY